MLQNDPIEKPAEYKKEGNMWKTRKRFVGSYSLDGSRNLVLSSRKKRLAFNTREKFVYTFWQKKVYIVLASIFRHFGVSSQALSAFLKFSATEEISIEPFLTKNLVAAGRPLDYTHRRNSRGTCTVFIWQDIDARSQICHTLIRDGTRLSGTGSCKRGQTEGMVASVTHNRQKEAVHWRSFCAWRVAIEATLTRIQ